MARLQVLVCSLIIGTSVELLADTLTGSIVDEAGRPLAAVRVDVATAAPKVGRGIFCPSCYLDCAKWAKTDAQGRFEIKDLDPALKFRLLATVSGKQSLTTGLRDPTAGPVTLTLKQFPADVPPNRIVEGTVINPQGTPLEGVLVDPFMASVGDGSASTDVRAQPAVTDHFGRFKMLLERDYTEVYAEIIADGYARALRGVNPGVPGIEITIERGTSVTGQLIYQEKPAVGQPIAVVQVDRTFRTQGQPFIKAVLAVTDQEGKFQFQNLPPMQEYAIFTPVAKGNSGPILVTKRFQARENDQSRDLGTLVLTEGVALAGKVELSAGGPLPKDLKISLGREPAWDLNEFIPNADGSFRITNLPPEKYEVRIAAEDVQLVPSLLNYQLLSSNTFAIGLKTSVENVKISLRTEAKSHSLDGKSGDALIAAQKADEASIAYVPPAPGSLRPAVELGLFPVPPDGPKVTVNGLVLTPEGTPLSKADVILQPVKNQLTYSGGIDPAQVLARTKTDDQGRFTFTEIPVPLAFRELLSELVTGNGTLQVLAKSEARGWTWGLATSLDQNPVIRLVLRPQADVRGVVVDHSGRPMANVEVSLGAILNGRDPMQLYQSRMDDESISLVSSPHFAVQTDQKGAFTMPHVPVESLVHLISRGKHIIVDTHAAQEKPAERSQFKVNNRAVPVTTSPVEFKQKFPLTLNVRIVDDAGRIVSNGAVTCDNQPGTEYSSTRVDKNGMAHIPVSSPGQYKLNYVCDASAPVLATGGEFLFPGGQPTADCEIQLPKPNWLTGRVVNKDSGKGIPGARLHYSHFSQDERRPGIMNVQSFALSQKNGEFRIPIRTGFGHMSVASLFGLETTGARSPFLNAIEGQDLEPVTISISRGLVVHGEVVDEKGTPISGVDVHAITVVPGIDQKFSMGFSRSGKDGRFVIAGLPPQLAVRISAFKDGLAARSELTGQPQMQEYQTRNADLRIVLRPAVQVAGRVMRNGQPQSGVRMTLKRGIANEYRFLNIGTVETDSNGRYLLGGLQPGDRYQLAVGTDDGSAAPDWPHLAAYAGRTVPPGASGIIELQDANLVKLEQSLSGVVVDTSGQPLSGITVVPTLVQIGPGRDTPAVKTDAQGRFTVRGLPNNNIELLVYKQTNPRGGSIKNASHIVASFNQQDLRIVLDPTLEDDVPSLDSN